MKKLILVVILFISFTGISQNIFESEYVQIGTWSKIKRDYKWKDPVKARIGFLFQQNVIIANDEARSIYNIVGSPEIDEEDGTVYWDAYDEQERKCIVMFYNQDSYLIFSVIYQDYCFKYYCIEIN